MEPSACSSGSSSQRRNGNNRRQYQSCDRCRRGRRRCNAVILGIDPFGRNDLITSTPINHRSCSGCQKFNKECTFEWLRSLPPQILPRRLKTQPLPCYRTFQNQDGFDALSPLADSSPTYNAQEPEVTDPWTIGSRKLGLNTGLDDLSFPKDGLRSTINYQSFAATVYNSMSANRSDLNSSSGGHLLGAISPWKNDTSGSCVQNDMQIGDRPIDLGRDRNDETLWANDSPSTRQGDPIMSMLPADGSQRSSLTDQNDLLEIGHCQHRLQEPFVEWHATTTSPSSRITDATLLADRDTTQDWPTIGMQECQLAEKSDKITISTNLMGIYLDSLENALACWISKSTCPYKIETSFEMHSQVRNEHSGSSSVPKTLYNLVYTLDAVFSSLRARPLTRAEDAGSSKTLKLTIMAFACQWSHSSRNPSTHSHGATSDPTDENRSAAPRPTFDSKASEAQEFDRLMQLSVWHESQRYIDRWGYCGSFRVILATIVLFCTQQPLDEDDLYNNNGAMSTLHDFEAGHPGNSNFNCLDDQLNSGTTSNIAAAQGMVNGSAPNLTLLSSFCYCNKNLQHVEKGLGHLLTWRKTIRNIEMHKQKHPLHNPAPDAPCNTSPEPQRLSEFNLIFWLGVMCDTTSSVLHQRPLIIPDVETLTKYDAAPRLDSKSITTTNVRQLHKRWDVDYHHHAPSSSTQPVDIWGSYIMDADSIWQTSLVAAENLTTLQTRSRMLQQAVPLKLLFWRRLANLQTLVFPHKHLSAPSPTKIEDAIKEALAVHHYWTVNYDEFFTACTRSHSHLPTQYRTWYLVLVLGWNLGCLILARYIDFVDKNAMSDRSAQTVRGSSAFTSELQKSSAYAIAEAARVSTVEDASLVAATTTASHSHPALLGQSPLLSDPHTEKVAKALEVASNTLLYWLWEWQNPAAVNCVLHLSWLYSNTNFDELSRHCVSCINALYLLKSKSDIARLTAEHLTVQYNLINAAIR